MTEQAGNTRNVFAKYSATAEITGPEVDGWLPITWSYSGSDILKLNKDKNKASGAATEAYAGLETIKTVTLRAAG